MTTGHGTAITPFAPQGIEQAFQLAKTLASSGLMPQTLRGKPQDVLVVLITGHELGLSPMQAVRGIHVVQGRAVMSADLMVALAVRNPACEWFRLTESNDKIATYEAKRRGSPQPVRMSFTIEQARQASLTGKDNWKNYPAAMLRARCSAALVRAVFPDLALGVYEQDEAEDFAPTLTAPPLPAFPEAVEPAASPPTTEVMAEEEGQPVPPGDDPQAPTDDDPILAAIEAATTQRELLLAMPKTQAERVPYGAAYEAARKRLSGRA